MSEILAPAGDKNSAFAAINAGADAIYLGLKQFSARSSAENFGVEEFAEVVKTAHLFGVKVYVAMNTLVKNTELEAFLRSAAEAWNNGADALKAWQRQLTDNALRAVRRIKSIAPEAPDVK